MSVDLVSVAEQIASERNAARVIAASLGDTLPWENELPQSWRTLGLVQELTAMSLDILERDPLRARDVAQFALAIATSLPEGAYPLTMSAQVEGNAWRALGIAHRYLSVYDAALRAFDAARRALAKSGALAQDEAVVELGRAVVLSAINRQDEALALLNQIVPIFEEYGDRNHVVQCTMMKGIISSRSGDLYSARRAFEETLSAARVSDDLHTLAAAYLNLGRVCGDLGDTATSVQYLQQARSLMIGLDMSGDVTRVDWSLAIIMVNNREYAKAITLLEGVRSRFLSRHMIEEAGLAALYIVDCLVATSERAAAQALTETVIAEFSAAGLNERALTALGYLRDLLRTSANSQKPVAHVRTYIEQLRAEPTRLFLPLPE